MACPVHSYWRCIAEILAAAQVHVRCLPPHRFASSCVAVQVQWQRSFRAVEWWERSAAQAVDEGAYADGVPLLQKAQVGSCPRMHRVHKAWLKGPPPQQVLLVPLTRYLLPLRCVLGAGHRRGARVVSHRPPAVLLAHASPAGYGRSGGSAGSRPPWGACCAAVERRWSRHAGGGRRRRAVVSGPLAAAGAAPAPRPLGALHGGDVLRGGLVVRCVPPPPRAPRAVGSSNEPHLHCIWRQRPLLAILEK